MDGFSPLHDIHHQIYLASRVSSSNYPHSNKQFEYKKLHHQVEELLQKGSVCKSLSSCTVLALLIPKKNGMYCMCVDNCVIAKITVHHHFPILQLDNLQDPLSGATVFNKLDLKSSYHQIRIRSSDEWKIIFKTCKELFKWLIIPFSLSNAPSTFMRVMNQALRLLMEHVLLFISMIFWYIVK